MAAAQACLVKSLKSRIVDEIENCNFLPDFQYNFRFSRSTADLLTVISNRTARALNRTGATRVAASDIFKASDRVWHTSLLHRLKSYRISGQVFGLMSSFLSNRWLPVVLDGNSSKE